MSGSPHEDEDASVTDNKQELTSGGGVPVTSRISTGAPTCRSSLPTPAVISQSPTSTTTKQGSTRIPSGIPSAAPHKSHSSVGRSLSGPTTTPHKPHNTVGRTLSGPTTAPHKPHSTVGRTLSGPSEVPPHTKQSSVCKNSSIPSRISRPTNDCVSGRTIQNTKHKLINSSASDNKSTEAKTSVNKNEQNAEKSNVNKDKTKCNINVNKNVINNLKSRTTVNITENRETNENKNNENVEKNKGGKNVNKQCDLKTNHSENKNKTMSCMSSSEKTVISVIESHSNMINNFEINSNQPLSERTGISGNEEDKTKTKNESVDSIDVIKSRCETNTVDNINKTDNPNLSSESDVILKHELEISEKESDILKSNVGNISAKETKIPMKKVSSGHTSKIPSAMHEQKDKLLQSRKIVSALGEDDSEVKDAKCESFTDNTQVRASRPRERTSDKKISQNNLSKILMTKDKSSEIQRSFLKFPNTQLRSRSPRNKDEVHHKCIENEENRKSLIEQPKNDILNEKQLTENTKEIMCPDSMTQDTVDTKAIPKIPLNGNTSKLSRQCELYEKEKQTESQNHEMKKKSSHRENFETQVDESMENADMIRLSNEQQVKKSQSREPSLSKMEFKDHNIGSHRENIELHLDLRKTSEMQYAKRKSRSREPSLPKTESREMSKLASLTENLTDCHLPVRSPTFDSYQQDVSVNEYNINSQTEFQQSLDRNTEIESEQIRNNCMSQSPESKLELQRPVRTPSPRHDITYRVHETQRKKRPRSCEPFNSRTTTDNPRELYRMSVPTSKSFEQHEYQEPIETQLLRKEIESRTELLKFLNQQNNRKSKSRDSSESKTYRREACHLPLQRQTADVVRIPDHHQSKNSTISEPVHTLQEFQEALRLSPYKNDFEPCNEMLKILNQQSRRRSRSCEPIETQNEHRSNKEEVKYPFESAKNKVSKSPSDLFENTSSVVKEGKKDLKVNLKENLSHLSQKVKDSHSTNDNVWESRNSCDSIISKEDSRHSPEEIGMESFGRQALTSFQELPILNGLSHLSNDKRKIVENRNVDNGRRFNRESKSLESDYQPEQKIQDNKSQMINDNLKRSRTPDSFSDNCISRDSTIDSGISDKQRSGVSSDCSPIQGWPPHQAYSLESKSEGEWSFRRSEAKPNSISFDRMHLNLPKIQVCGEEVNANEDFSQPDNLVIEKKESRVSRFVRMFNRKEAESTSRSSSRERRPRLGRSPNRMLGMCLQAPGKEIEGDPRWQRRNSKGDFYSLSDEGLDRNSDSLRSDSSNGISERKSRRNSKGDEDSKIRWWRRGESVDCSGRKSMRSESLCDKQKQRVIRGDSNSLDDGRNRGKECLKPRSPSVNPLNRRKLNKGELFAYFEEMRGRQRNNKDESHSFRSSSCTPLGRNSAEHNGKESGESGDSLPRSLLEPEDKCENRSKGDSLGNGLLKRYMERRRSSGEWAKSLKTKAKDGNGLSQNQNTNGSHLQDSNETDPTSNHLYKKFYSHCVILPLKKKKKENTNFVEMINHKSLDLYPEDPLVLDCQRRASLDSLCKDLEKSKTVNVGSEIKQPNPYASVESIDRNHPVIDDLLSEILENVSLMEKDLKETTEWKKKERKSKVESGDVPMDDCESEAESMTLGEFFRGGISQTSRNNSRITTLISKFENTDSS